MSSLIVSLTFPFAANELAVTAPMQLAMVDAALVTEGGGGETPLRASLLHQAEPGVGSGGHNTRDVTVEDHNPSVGAARQQHHRQQETSTMHSQPGHHQQHHPLVPVGHSVSTVIDSSTKITSSHMVSALGLWIRLILGVMFH